MQLIKEYKSIDEAASVENSFLPMSMNGSNDMMFSAIKKRLSDLSPTLCLLPRIESIINKEDPTLEDILGTCSHDPKLLGKLTRRSVLQVRRSSLQEIYFLRRDLVSSKAWLFGP